MATHINNQRIRSPYDSPKISYLVTYSATRDRFNVIYNFTIYTYISTGGSFGTGKSLKCAIGVGGVTAEVSLKENSDIWNNSGGSSEKLVATDTLSVTCDSKVSEENQTVTFNVTRPDGSGDSGKVSTTNYYVISPYLHSYTVSYDANGGSGAPDPITEYLGYAINVSWVVPTREGYNFIGWNTNKDGSGDSYSSGAYYYNNATSCTLYAQWELKTYTISFNANGGSGAPDPKTKQHGVNLTIPSMIPVREGYRFLYWSDGVYNFYPSGSCGYNYNCTLYAAWEQLGILHINQKGTWKKGMVRIKNSGTWKKGIPWIKKNGTWLKGG